MTFGLAASIDIGSNSAQLLIADVLESAPQTKLQRIETLRLGADLSEESGSVSPESMTNLARVLQQFDEIIRNTRARLMHIVFTDAMRRAQNADQVLTMAQKIVRHPAVILTGEQEAQFAYLGVSHGVLDKKWSVLDIGAGSIEIANPSHSISLPLGAIRMAQRFGEIPSADYNPFLKKTLAELDLKPFARGKLSLCGGAAIALALLIHDQDHFPLERIEELENTPISATQIAEIQHKLSTLTQDARSRLPGMGQGREKIILAACGALVALLKVLKPKECVLSMRGLRHGLLTRSSI